MPEYSGGLTGLAGDLGGIQDVGGRLTGEIMAGNEYNRLRNKENEEEKRRLAKEKRGEAVSRLNIAMEHISKAKTPEEHDDAVKIYNTLGDAWTSVMGEGVPMMAYNRPVITNLNSIINAPDSPESKKAIEGMSIPEQKIVMDLIEDRLARKVVVDKITGHISEGKKYVRESGKESDVPAYIKPELTIDQEAQKAGKIEAAKQKEKIRVNDTASIRNYEYYIDGIVRKNMQSEGRSSGEINAVIKSKSHRDNYITIWNRNHANSPLPITDYNDWRKDNSSFLNNDIITALTGGKNKNVGSPAIDKEIQTALDYFQK